MNSSAAEKIIVALDVDNKKQALALAGLLSGHVGMFKIGLQRYTADGPALVRAGSLLGKIFLDLKLHDIPNTVARAVESAGKLGVGMLTIHLSGGGEMIRAGVGARRGELLCFGVGCLARSDDEKLHEGGVGHKTGEAGVWLAVPCGA